MTDRDCHCAQCVVVEKICRQEKGKGPSFCPTKKKGPIIDEALKRYDDPEVKDFARMASIQEGACYVERDAKPFVMVPTKSRVEELIEFSRRMGYKRLGLAFCGGLAFEASILAEILKKQGFEIISVSCKVGRIPKERIGIKEEEKVQIGTFESMCNPIAQAMILNDAKTDFNVLLGLCLGHECIFLKYVDGFTTVFAVKDRVTGHNPMAALYTSQTYYQRLMKRTIGEMKDGIEEEK